MRKRFTELVSRFNGVCGDCRRAIARNAPMVYDWHERKSYCKECGDRLANTDASTSAARLAVSGWSK